MINPKCKICRRVGVKLFLKGEKCLSPKCPMLKKNYPPGPKRKKRAKAPSEYGKELREKRKLREWYNLKEIQFRKYVKEALNKAKQGKDASDLLIKILETRLDNVVFRLGFACSRSEARQMISHCHFLVNNKSVNIASFLVGKGDIVKIKPISKKKKIFQNIPITLKKHTAPNWLKLNVAQLEGKVTGEPSLEEAAPPVEISAIFEYYSR
ncbi:30S ribosomal protein S4 [Candidatus Parcubacteria bacterium]|nr:30S ribosomal protein S4 [Candidatus Parcubacteria bacterium]